MAEGFDTQQVVAFLKRAGDNLRRAGEELREEAQRLLAEVQDPAHQQRVRARLKDLGGWFKRTTSEAGDALEDAMKRAESTLRGGADRVRKTATAAAASVKSGKAKAVPRAATAAKRAGSRVGKSAKRGAKKGAK
jgi:ElaB/YqjD/DUF883 family membrane-anchored ribosome-binding protein